MAVGLLLAVGAAFLRAGWRHGPGLPLDDPYIYFDYAREAAHGAWLQYNAGDRASAGATSFLWMALLAGARGLGARGAALIWWDVAMEAACAVLALLQVDAVLRILGVTPWGAAALTGSLFTVGTVVLPL